MSGWRPAYVKNPAGFWYPGYLSRGAASVPAATSYFVVRGMDNTNDACWFDDSGTYDVATPGAANPTLTMKIIMEVVDRTYSGVIYALSNRSTSGGFHLEVRFASNNFRTRLLWYDNTNTARATAYITQPTEDGEIQTIHAVVDSAGSRLYLNGANEVSASFTSGYGSTDGEFVLGAAGRVYNGSSLTAQNMEDVGLIAASVARGTALSSAQVAADFAAQGPANLHLADATEAWDWVADTTPKDGLSAVVGAVPLSYNTSGSDTAVVREEIAPPSFSVTSTTANANGTQIDLTWTASAGTVYAATYTTRAAPDKATLKAGTGAAATDSDAHTVGASVLSGLDDHTAYYVYALAEGPNGLDSGVRYLGEVTTPDVTAPVLATWAQNAVTPTTVVVDYNITDAAPGSKTLAWVAVPTADTAPTVDEVLAGQESGGGAATFANQFSTSAGAATFTASGLDTGTAFDIYGAVQDADGNKIAAVSSFESTTQAALASFAAGTETATTIPVDYNANGTGTLHWVAVPTAEAAPSDTQVVAGQNQAGGSPTASGSETVSATGAGSYTITGMPLGNGVAYDVYGVLVTGGVNGAVETFEATLLDGLAPTVTTFSEAAKASTTIDYNLEADEDSTAYIALYTSAQSPLPSGSAVETQSATLGASEAVVADTAETKQVTGATSGTTYYAYCTFKDADGNYSAVSGPVTTTTNSVASYTFVENFTTSNNNAWYRDGVSSVFGSGASVQWTLKYVGVKRTYTDTTQILLSDGSGNGWALRIAGRDFSFLFDEFSNTLRQAISSNDGWNNNVAIDDVFVLHVVGDGTDVKIYHDGTEVGSVGYDGGMNASARNFTVGHQGGNITGSAGVSNPPVDVGHIAFSWNGTPLNAAAVLADFNATTPSNLHLTSATFAVRADPSDGTNLIVDAGADTMDFNTTDALDPPTIGTVTP